MVAAHKPQDKLKSTIFTKLKDPIPKMQQIGLVYSVPCGAEYGKEYVGQTSQTLEKRMKQHKSTIRYNTAHRGQKSKIRGKN